MNRIGKELRRSIRRDRRVRLSKVADKIEAFLMTGDIIGAFSHLRHWYTKYTGKSLTPSRANLENTRKIYEDLFKEVVLDDKFEYDFEYDGGMYQMVPLQMRKLQLHSERCATIKHQE